MKVLFTGEAIKTELMVVMLDKHGIESTEEFVHDPPLPDEDDFNRWTRVLVSEEDYPKAWQLFYEDKEGEI